MALARPSAMAFARSKGMPVISIAGFFRKGDLGLLVPVDSPIKEPKDIKGKRLVYTAGSMEAPFLDAFFNKAGVTRDPQVLRVVFLRVIKRSERVGPDSFHVPEMKKLV